MRPPCGLLSGRSIAHSGCDDSYLFTPVLLQKNRGWVGVSQSLGPSDADKNFSNKVENDRAPPPDMAPEATEEPEVPSHQKNDSQSTHGLTITKFDVARQNKLHQHKYVATLQTEQSAGE